MKLYTQAVAPNPTKVELYLAEKAAGGCEIPVEKIIVSLISGEHKSGENTKKNPLQRAPFLELDDGTFLAESLAIIEYFEELWPEPSMIGTTALERAQVRAIERSIDFDILYGLAMVVHATNSPVGYEKLPEVAARFTAFAKNPLAVLNERLSDGRPFVTGERPTIADCTLAAALQFARFGGAAISPDYSHIVAWDETYRARDSVQSILIM